MNIEEIKAREQAATKGPWEDETTDVWIGDRHIAEVYSSPDTAFIAHARTDIPALIAEVERLTAENEKIGAQLDRFVETDFKVGAENATLKKALELMYAENKSYNPDGMGNPAWYIHQAQEQEGKHEY